MTIDDWRARYDGLNAETDRLRAEVERLQADIMNVHLKRAMLVVQRDAARVGEARAVEALDVFARAYRVSMLPFAPGIDEADGAYHWMPHGWPSVAEFKRANSVLSDSSALFWLAQQRREEAAGALKEFADEAGGIEELKACNISDLRSALRTRAAAIRAGEVPHE